MSNTKTEPAGEPLEKTDWIELVRQYVDSLQYGTVQITVHDSRVAQVDKTERVRFEQSQKKITPNNPNQKTGG